MSANLSECRLKYGDVYVTIFPDGPEIPWRLLPLQDFLNYELALLSKKHPVAFIEDEIFCKSVIDPLYVKNINALSAGIVSTVAGNILSYSGPHTIEVLNNTLNDARTLIQHPLHQAVELISRAFPAYTPEDIYAMDFGTMAMRLALAEQRLMKLGHIQEPVSWVPPGQEPPITKSRDHKPTPKVEIPKEKIEKKFADLNPSPSPTGPTIITSKHEVQSNLEAAEDSHAAMDYPVQKGQLLKKVLDGLDIEGMYGPYLEKMKAGQRLTPEDIVKSNQERVAAFKKKEAEANKPPEKPKQPIKRR